MVQVKGYDSRTLRDSRTLDRVRDGIWTCIRMIRTRGIDSIEISSLVISLKAVSWREGVCILFIRAQSICFIISDDGKAKVLGNISVAHANKTGENSVARGTAQDADICGSRQGHGGTVLTVVPNK